MAQLELAKLLLRRKELGAKLMELQGMKRAGDLLVTKVRRQSAGENVDEVIASVPLITLPQITAAFDDTARKLRITDAYVQKTNWDTTVDIGDSDLMKDYEESPELTAKLQEARSDLEKKK